MARPRLGSEKKNHRVGVFFTDSEYAVIYEKAKQTGSEPPDFLRQVGLGEKVKAQPIVPELNKEMAKNINDIIGLIHKVMRMVHAGEMDSMPKDLLESLLDELKLSREIFLGRWQ